MIVEKNILVTGATGFIGCNLVRRLLREGANVHVLLREDKAHGRLGDVASRLTAWRGDITDYASVRGCVAGSRPGIIYHLAADRDVSRDASLFDPMVDINIKGTLNLIKASMEEKIPLESFVNTGTCEEYGDSPVPFEEDRREVPVSPYSASKVASTYFCQMAYKSFSFPVVTLRPFLTYGPYQRTDMFIPSLIRHCLEGKDFAMTAGDQTREFNHVNDIVDAYLLAAARPEALGEVINIGNGIEYRLSEIAEKIVRMTDSAIRLNTGALPKRPGEAAHFFCSNEKAKRILGWAPKTGIDEGLADTIAWYKVYFAEQV